MGCRRGLACSPDPVARFMRVIPKLALLFLVVHVSAMIYTAIYAAVPGKPQSAGSNPAEPHPPLVVVGQSNRSHVAVRLAGQMKFTNQSNSGHAFQDVNNGTKNQSKLAFLDPRRAKDASRTLRLKNRNLA